MVNQIISDYKCEGTFAYLDDITVSGKTREEHDKNLKQFLKAASDCNLTLNENKCVFATRKLKLLGYYISDGVMRPDLERVKPITNLPNPTNKRATTSNRYVFVLCTMVAAIFGKSKTFDIRKTIYYGRKSSECF